MDLGRDLRRNLSEASGTGGPALSAYSAVRIKCTAPSMIDTLYGPNRHWANMIGTESEWRLKPADAGLVSCGTKVIATRWHSFENETREVGAQNGDCYMVKVVMRKMNCRFSVAGRTIEDRAAMPGMVHVTEPGAPSRCLFRGPYDNLHLHVPTDLVAEFRHEMPGSGPTPTLPTKPALTPDPVIERLARALLEANELSFAPLYADSICIAIVARLAAPADRSITSERPKMAPLPRWRLKRAFEYIDNRLAEPVTLADVASAAGLTRMHFAAQFKVATGLRPHEYLLRCRIERAQEMLARQNTSMVDIALSVGFGSQSHFTSVFTRFVGQPPRAWQQSQCT